MTARTAPCRSIDDGGPADDGGTDDDNGGVQGVLKFDEVSFQVIEGQVNAVVRVERSRGESGASHRRG